MNEEPEVKTDVMLPNTNEPTHEVSHRKEIKEETLQNVPADENEESYPIQIKSEAADLECDTVYDDSVKLELLHEELDLKTEILSNHEEQIINEPIKNKHAEDSLTNLKSPFDNTVQKNLNIPTSKPSLKCNICHSKFIQKKDLHLHKLKHIREKRFECNTCSYTSARKSILKKHMKIHTGEKPYTKILDTRSKRISELVTSEDRNLQDLPNFDSTKTATAQNQTKAMINLKRRDHKKLNDHKKVQRGQEKQARNSHGQEKQAYAGKQIGQGNPSFGPDVQEKIKLKSKKGREQEDVGKLGTGSGQKEKQNQDQERSAEQEDEEKSGKSVPTKKRKGKKFLPRSSKIEQFANTRPWTKKSSCPYCFQDVTHFPRHLERHHPDQGAVKEFLSKHLKDPKRKELLNAIRRQGNFISTSHTKTIRPIRRPKGRQDYIGNEENLKEKYITCQDCLGYFKRNYLRRHRKHCALRPKPNELGVREQHLSAAQLFTVCSGAQSDFYLTLRVKNEVFPFMRNDEISKTAMNDTLICCYAESLLRKRKVRNVISNKMRELGRLLLTLKEVTGLQRLFDMLKPQFFDNCVSATKVISGYDEETRSFKASSLAVHMGTTLKQICDICTNLIKKSSFFSCLKPEEALKDVKRLKKLVEYNWNSEIWRLGLKNVNEQQHEKSKLLPLAQEINGNDLSCLTTDVRAQMNHDVLKSDENAALNLEVRRKRNNNDQNEEEMGIKKRKITRIRWTAKQKKLIAEHFEQHIKKKQAPRKHEVEVFINQHKHTFKDRNWVTVKAVVYNFYK